MADEDLVYEIIKTTVTARLLLTFPVAYYSHNQRYRMQSLSALMIPIYTSSPALKDRNDPLKPQMARMSEVYRMSKLSLKHLLLPAALQCGLFCGMSVYIRSFHVQYNHEQTTPPYLSGLLSLLTFANMSTHISGTGGKVPLIFKIFRIASPIVIFPVSICSTPLLSVYWTTSAGFSLAQNILFRILFKL